MFDRFRSYAREVVRAGMSGKVWVVRNTTTRTFHVFLSKSNATEYAHAIGAETPYAICLSEDWQVLT